MGFRPLLPRIYDYYISIVSFSLLLLKRRIFIPDDRAKWTRDYIRT